jgi:Zn-dependent peptidase ImmA (M78 family)/transcriptional regulator with XRE-family HTH domain
MTLFDIMGVFNYHLKDNQETVMELSDLAPRLKIAREQCGLTQQAVADALNLPRTAVTQMEGGNRAISTLELTKLAKIYRKPFSYFLNDDHEYDEDIEILLYRAAPDLQASPKIKQQVDYYVDLCREGVALEKLLGYELRLGPPLYPLSLPTCKGNAVLQGEMIAEQERKRLGIGIGPIGDIAELLANQGIWASSTDLPETMSGLFLHHPKIGLFILVNAQHVKARKRFSYAHEYAHALLDRDGSVRISSKNNNTELVGVRANAFAAAFLMPADGVNEFLRNLNKCQPSRQEQVVFDVVTGGKSEGESRSIANSQQLSYQHVAKMAHHFGVSYQATSYRLRSLKIISQKKCDEFIEQELIGRRYLKALHMFSDLENQEDPKSQNRELITQLVQLSIEAYNRQEISRGRIFELGDMLKLGGKALFEFAQTSA